MKIILTILFVCISLFVKAQSETYRFSHSKTFRTVKNVWFDVYENGILLETQLLFIVDYGDAATLTYSDNLYHSKGSKLFVSNVEINVSYIKDNIFQGYFVGTLPISTYLTALRVCYLHDPKYK